MQEAPTHPGWPPGSCWKDRRCLWAPAGQFCKVSPGSQFDGKGWASSGEERDVGDKYRTKRKLVTQWKLEREPGRAGNRDAGRQHLTATSKGRQRALWVRLPPKVPSCPACSGSRAPGGRAHSHGHCCRRGGWNPRGRKVVLLRGPRGPPPALRPQLPSAGQRLPGPCGPWFLDVGLVSSGPRERVTWQLEVLHFSPVSGGDSGSWLPGSRAALVRRGWGTGHLSPNPSCWTTRGFQACSLLLRPCQACHHRFSWLPDSKRVLLVPEVGLHTVGSQFRSLGLTRTGGRGRPGREGQAGRGR